MGQDQAKPKGAADATAAEYAHEEGKMHHVTTKDTIVAVKPPYEDEADRLLEQLRGLKAAQPLLTSSVSGSLIAKRDRLLEESTESSEALKQHQLFTDDIIRLFAQYQTIEMREGAAAAKRAEEIVARMAQTVYYSNVLRSNALAQTMRLASTVERLSDCEVIQDEVSALHDRVVEISHLAMEVNGYLSEEERAAVRDETERRMNAALVSQRSRSISPAATPTSLTPRS